MSGGITVREFKHIPGVNDAEYIKKLEALCEINKRVLNTAVAKIKRMSAQLKEQPTIIHCKECKFAHMTVGGECKYCDIWFPDEKTYMPGDYYCASAEKRGES
jgi:hypothetical protein